MGASSSSAYWGHAHQYAHKDKSLTVYYETTVHNNVRLVQDHQFRIEDVLPILEKKNMFPDITLIIDIDATLGEAIIINDHPNNPDIVILDNHETHKRNLQRLENLKKMDWFHNGTCAFFIRPYFEPFLKFCIQNFKQVIIWTNGIQRHADDMVNLIDRLTGTKLTGYGRTYSTGYMNRKVVTTIGLDPTKTWMVDDDHNHHFVHPDRDPTYEVNPEIKFFHTPVFSVNFFEKFSYYLDHWHEGDQLDLYDDWFLFLIWNWNYMKENNIEMKQFIRKENKFIH